MSYPGIHIRITTLDGELLSDSSDNLNFAIHRYINECGLPPALPVIVGGGWLRETLIEIWPAELDELPAVPDDVSGLAGLFEQGNGELEEAGQPGIRQAADAVRLRRQAIQGQRPIARIGRIVRIGLSLFAR